MAVILTTAEQHDDVLRAPDNELKAPPPPLADGVLKIVAPWAPRDGRPMASIGPRPKADSE
jgi:hypothetical protein